MIYKNNVCSVCGLSCDDIDVEINGDEITVYNACKMGESKYHKLRSKTRVLDPLIDGKKVKWDKAIEKAAKILKNSQRPLLFMGSEISNEAMGVGIHIAEYLKGIVDGNATMCHGPTISGVQEAGLPTSTLGVVKNRSDLVIFWGCNPLESHPRLLSRYSIFPRGYFNVHGGKGRKMIVVDPRKTITAELADEFIQVEPNKDFELMSAIGAILKGHDINGSVGGVSKHKIYALAEEMKSCKFGAIFVGLGVASSVGKHRNIEKALMLTRALNEYTRFTLLVNRGHANVAGFNQILTWQSGYPYGVDYSRGYPRFNPGETTTIDLLKNKEVDSLLVIASDLGAHLPTRAVEYMADIPVISIEVSNCPTTMLSDVVIPGVMAGMECEGTFYRMDDVPLRARKFVDPPFKFAESNADILKQIFDKIICK